MHIKSWPLQHFLRKSIFGNFPCQQEKHAVWTGTVSVLKQIFIGYPENPIKTAYLSAQKKTNKKKTVKRIEKNIVHKKCNRISNQP